MIALAGLFAIGALQFIQQPLPRLDVGARAFPAALAQTNAQVADLDGDKTLDLVLPDGVWLQKAGAYPRSLFVPLPKEAQVETLRAEPGRLLVYGGGRVASYALAAGTWRAEWSSDLPPEVAPEPGVQPIFYDFDADGAGELIVPGENAVLVVAASAAPAIVATLPIYPPIRPDVDTVQNLWDSVAKPALGETASRVFSIEFEDQQLLTREIFRTGPRQVAFHFVAYGWHREEAGVFQSQATDTWDTGPLPDVMTPYRTGKSGALAFAGARLADHGATRLTDTVTEVYLADRNAPLQTLRTKSAPAFLALADFDGDGDDDLLAQTNTLTSGPPREVIARMASATSLRHTFMAYVRQADGRFDAQPRENLSIDINLGATALQGGPRWQAYRQGALTVSSADFNGDGRADIAASLSSGKIAIWLNQEGVFQKKPDTIIAATGTLVPADVDDDGRADLVDVGDDAHLVWFSR